MSKLIYAGIGSRETPEHVQTMMQHIAKVLANNRWTLRSGAAGGADSAFELGALQSGGTKEIYLPWNGFNSAYHQPLNDYIVPDDAQFSQAMLIAKSFHPAWHRCSQGAQRLHARNAFQILGLNLDTPADCVICWTPNGKATGGTGQAIRMAEYYEVPVFNLFNTADLNRLLEFTLAKERITHAQ